MNKMKVKGLHEMRRAVKWKEVKGRARKLSGKGRAPHAADHAQNMRRPCSYVLYWAHPYKGRRIRGRRFPRIFVASPRSVQKRVFLGGMGTPQKTLVFLTPRGGDAQKAAKNRLNKSANPSPLIRVGPAWRSAKVRHVVAVGRRHGADGLIPQAFRDVTDRGPRWPDLHADATQPATRHFFPFFHFLSL